MRKPILFTLLLSIITPFVYSQLNYLRSGTGNIPGVYSDLGTNGTVITTSNFDNANSAPQNIGFTFKYNGVSFTQFTLNTNGFIKLGSTAPSTDSLFYTSGNGVTGGVLNSTNPADTNMLCVFNHDLKAGISSPEYRVYTSGVAGSQVCTIQFKNVRDKTTSPVVQFDNMEFQVKLYETSNTIEYIYGNWIAATAGSSSTKTAAIGLKGYNNTTPQLLVVTKASTQQWAAATFVSGNYPGAVACNFGKPAARPVPDAGRTFRFLQAQPHDAIVNLYTLGSIPHPYGCPNTDSAIVRNIGMDTLKNIGITLNVSGTNTYTDTKTIPVLAPAAAATIGFAAYTPSNTGLNTVSVTLSNDDNNQNNSDSYSQNVNDFVFSYADAGAPKSSLGGNFPSYFVTKYTITGSTTVSGANIFIANNVAAIGQKVYAVLFNNTSTKLDSSAALIITPADTGKYHHFTFPKDPTISNNSFYVGLAQPTTAVNYFPLGYQHEYPTRYGSYFITTYLSAPNFADFGGANSNTPYRLMIQAVVTNTTGVLENTSDKNISVYPNPFNDHTTFYIRNNNVQNYSFNLYDVTGRVVKMMSNFTSGEFKMERGHLENGIYFYTISTSEKIVDSGKLIIE